MESFEYYHQKEELMGKGHINSLMRATSKTDPLRIGFMEKKKKKE